jgi:hypothetical protein
MKVVPQKSMVGVRLPGTMIYKGEPGIFNTKPVKLYLVDLGPEAHPKRCLFEARDEDNGQDLFRYIDGYLEERRRIVPGLDTEHSSVVKHIINAINNDDVWQAWAKIAVSVLPAFARRGDIENVPSAHVHEYSPEFSGVQWYLVEDPKLSCKSDGMVVYAAYMSMALIMRVG